MFYWDRSGSEDPNLIGWFINIKKLSWVSRSRITRLSDQSLLFACVAGIEPGYPDFGGTVTTELNPPNKIWVLN